MPNVKVQNLNGKLQSVGWLNEFDWFYWLKKESSKSKWQITNNE
jgi:hypothetical protein